MTVHSCFSRLLAVVVALAVSACAARGPVVGRTVHRMDPERGTFVALRDFAIRSGPSSETPVVDRVVAGTRFFADVDISSPDGWLAVRVRDRHAGYVFGHPFERLSSIADREAKR